MNEKFDKIAKVEQLTKMLGRSVRLIVILPCKAISQKTAKKEKSLENWSVMDGQTDSKQTNSPPPLWQAGRGLTKGVVRQRSSPVATEF